MIVVPADGLGRMKIDRTISLSTLSRPLDRLFELAAAKTRALNAGWDTAKGTPVFTVAGKYTTRGWTEWTQGFQYGCGILIFDATGDRELLETSRANVRERMAPHVTHTGVHDHGFNNLSTYGNLRRLMREGRLAADEWEMAFYEMAIMASGAVQAARWSPALSAARWSPALSAARSAQGHGGGGYVYSFNGPHSLFIDTMRTIRILGVAYQLGHALMGENDQRFCLLNRLVTHGLTTAEFNIYYGEGRDGYDTAELRGRTAHEAIFNRNDGRFRCPSSQQGYSPWSTWTRGLAWAVLGFAEELEFLKGIASGQFERDKAAVLAVFEKAARATADFYIAQATAADGVPYWDTGAPNLHRLGDWRGRPAEVFNEHEPVDSSAAAIAAQGLIRLGRYLGADGERYTQAGLLTAATLLGEPYLSTNAAHEGLLLHSVYHRPNGWDYIPPGRKVPCGESSMWGDYHLLELGVLLRRMADGKYLTFFDV